MRDVNGFSTVEAFLKQYAVPNFGYGGYEVYKKNRKGEMAPTASVNIKAPLGYVAPTPGAQQGTSAREIFEMQRQMQADARKNGSDSGKELELALTLMDKLGGGEKGMDPMAMMFLTKMFDKPEVPAGPDPITIAMLTKLEELEKSANKPPPMPMQLPPPLPPPDPMAAMAPILQMMMQQSKDAQAQAQLQQQAQQAQQAQQQQQFLAIMQTLMAPKPERNVIGEISSMASLFKSDDAIGTKDLLNLIPTFKDILAPKPEKDAMSMALEQFRMVRMFKEEFGLEEQQSGGGGASFWDAVSALIQSDLGERVGAAISSDAASIKRDQDAKQPQGEPAQESGPLQIPREFNTFADAANAAEDTPTRVKAVLGGLQVLVRHKGFRQHVTAVLSHAKKNEKKESIEYLRALLEALSEADTLTKETVEKVIVDFRQHWVLILKTIGFDITEDPDPYVPGQDEEEEPLAAAAGGDGEEPPPDDEIELDDEDGEVEPTDLEHLGEPVQGPLEQSEPVAALPAETADADPAPEVIDVPGEDVTIAHRDGRRQLVKPDGTIVDDVPAEPITA
jgi:hypothetical protein